MATTSREAAFRQLLAFPYEQLGQSTDPSING
jgi:hypothetical protein